MKNIIKNLTISIVCLVFFFSCIDDLRFGDNALEKMPGTDMNIDSVFNRAELARRFLWSTYHFLYYAFPASGDASNDQAMQGNNFESLSDCWHSVLGWDWHTRLWYEGSLSATDEWQSRFSYYRSGCLNGVRAAWIFIENVGRVPDMSDQEKARLTAEAKIIIAACYFDLFRHYGGIPLIERVYEAADEPKYNPRASIEEMVKFMVDKLDEAAAEPELPWRISEEDNSTWFGRLTRGAAMGLKAKILLYAASPLFNNDVPYIEQAYWGLPAVENRNVWYGDYKQERWDDVKKACEDFFTENAKYTSWNYALVTPTSFTEDGYRRAFRRAYWERGNEEKILSTIKYTESLEWQNSQTLNLSARLGARNPTAEFMEMFPMANGAPFDTSNVYVRRGPGNFVEFTSPETTSPYDMPAGANPNNRYIFDNRDPRLYETLFVQKREEQWRGSNTELWPGGNYWRWGDGYMATYLANGMGMFKWCLDFNNDRTRELPMQFPYLRMAEMHFIYAEALAETGDLTNACVELNKVRARVGLGPIENFVSGVLSDKNVFRKELLRERACELALEDVRFHDMVRHKLQDEFTKPLHSLWTYRKDGVYQPQGTGSYPELWYEKRRITQFERAWWKDGFWTNKWYLSSFPIDEVNKKIGITQNPGW